MQDKMTEINPDLELRFPRCMPILHREVLCKSVPKHPEPYCWCCNYTVTSSGHERTITRTLLHFWFLTGTYCVSSALQVRTFHAHGDVLIRSRFSLDLKIPQWWSLTNTDTDPLLLNPTLLRSFKSQTDRISLHGQEKRNGEIADDVINKKETYIFCYQFSSFFYHYFNSCFHSYLYLASFDFFLSFS